MDETKSNGNFVLAVLGALIGGIIGTLPWILCYVYANMMYSVLAVFIPIAAFKGYELLKGKIDKRLPVIIGVIAFIAITLATLVVIPHLLLIKEYGKTSMELLKLLYEYDAFKSAIIQDYIFSLLFTALGAGGIIMNIKRSIDAGDEKVSFTNPMLAPSNDDIDAVKDVFKKRGALDKEHMLDKADLMDEIKGKESVLNFLITRGIVVRKKDKYYYSEENEAHPGKRAVKIFAITFGVMMLAIILIAVIAAVLS